RADSVPAPWSDPRGGNSRDPGAARRTLRPTHGAPGGSVGGVTFRETVWRLVRRIPRGRVATYGQLAALLGRPRAGRAVGGAPRRCPGDLPWHRVVNAQGAI